MPILDETLATLPRQHREALRWFIDRAGTVQPWPGPLPDGTLLAARRKGIYKPAWSSYALSVRQNLGGPYPDYAPQLSPDGSWIYRYFQETKDLAAGPREFTNRGLIKCMSDGVPVGVMRQTASSPLSRYRILGVASVVGYQDGYFLLKGHPLTGVALDVPPLLDGEPGVADRGRRFEDVGEFDVNGDREGRERILRSIALRRGQRGFREALVEAYQGRCAITGCDAVEALEAAHIMAYDGPSTNNPQNGLLLRSDIHTLFDLGLLGIDETASTVVLSARLAATGYAELQGAGARLPDDPTLRPSGDALRRHRVRWGLGDSI